MSDIRLPDISKLVISSSPHAHAPHSSVPQIMWMVILSLLPCILASCWFFGLRSLLVLAVVTLSCLATEAIANRMMRHPNTLRDASAIVTGLLLALNLPVTTPIWVCVLGGIFAIGLGKMVYGGLGYNPFNPALVGRIVLLIALPAILTTWVRPVTWKNGSHLAWLAPESNAVVTTATPLALQKPAARKQQLAAKTALPPSELRNPDAADCQSGSCREIRSAAQCGVRELFWGNIPGSMGETSKFAILLGGIFLMLFGIIRWQVPLCYIGTVALVTGIAHCLSPAVYPAPHLQILSGGLFFAAFFMATDMVTTPLGRMGAVVFGVGCGLITAVIRLWGSYPEGVTFSILIMNALTPLIDRFTAGRPFGTVRRAAVAQEVKK